MVESPLDGWTLTDINCTSQSSATGTDLAARRVEISLVAGDTVTCTFANQLTPPAGALVVRKVTRNGTGAFPFRIRDASGDVVARRKLTTRTPGGIGDASVIRLDPGRYRISERRPVTRRGVWRLSAVRCDGTRRPRGKPVRVRITAGRGAVCTFTNRLQRRGRIDIGAVSLGGLGTAGYVVTPASDPTVKRRQFATTKRQGVTARARGQSTHGLPFGRYVIQETAAGPTQSREWSLVAVLCNRRLVPFEQGRVTVRITRAEPEQRCRFINLRRRQPEPPPDTDVPSGNPVPGGAKLDLALDKRLVRSTGGRTPVRTFRLRIRNRSGVTANRAAVVDRLPAGTALIRARPSRGRCFTRGPRLLVCRLGDLRPGRRARVRVRVEQLDPGGGVNVAGVGSGSPEDILRNNLDAARIARVKKPRPSKPAPPSTCPSSASPIARPAC